MRRISAQATIPAKPFKVAIADANSLNSLAAPLNSSFDLPSRA
jgi:hypothetical protein